MNIASLEDTAGQMGQVSKLIRLLASSGITSEHLQRAIDNKSARINLAQYLQEGCPKVDYTQPVLKAKRGTKSGQSTALVHPAEFFVSSPKFYVDPDLARNIDLSPVPDDVREPKRLFALSSNLSDTAIANQAGGVEALTVKRTTLPQLMRECKRALEGETSIIKKRRYYLFYLEGKSGQLFPVNVCFHADELHAYCYRFGQDGNWNRGGVVCGN